MNHHKLWLGATFIGVGLINSTIQRVLLSWMHIHFQNPEDNFAFHITILAYIFGYFCWSVIYFIKLSIQHSLNTLSWKKFLYCGITSIIDIGIVILNFATLHQSEIFDNFKAFSFPFLILLLAKIYKDKFYKYQKVGTFIITIGAIICFITGTVYYFTNHNGKKNYDTDEYFFTLSIKLLLYLGIGLYYFNLDWLSRQRIKKNIGFQPSEVIAYLGIWEFTASIIIVFILNMTPINGHKICNSINVLSGIFTAEWNIILSFMLLPLFAAIFNIVVTMTTFEFGAGTAICFLLVRQTLFIFVYRMIINDIYSIYYISLVSLGEFIIIYGLAIFIFSPITPYVLIENEEERPLNIQ